MSRRARLLCVLAVLSLVGAVWSTGDPGRARVELQPGSWWIAVRGADKSGVIKKGFLKSHFEDTITLTWWHDGVYSRVQGIGKVSGKGDILEAEMEGDTDNSRDGVYRLSGKAQIRPLGENLEVRLPLHKQKLVYDSVKRHNVPVGHWERYGELSMLLKRNKYSKR